jgi:poly(3-hydroxybutyrate) depolymerase
MKFALVLVAALLAAFQVRADALGPGDYEFDLKSGGRERNYYVHIPPQGAIEARPVLILLHGGGGNAQQFRHDASLDAAAPV